VPASRRGGRFVSQGETCRPKCRVRRDDTRDVCCGQAVRNAKSDCTSDCGALEQTPAARRGDLIASIDGRWEARSV
jgi:hypothetical protein